MEILIRIKDKPNELLEVVVTHEGMDTPPRKIQHGLSDWTRNDRKRASGSGKTKSKSYRWINERNEIEKKQQFNNRAARSAAY